MMENKKKEFINPELIVINFKDDVIRTSTQGPGMHYDPDTDTWILD